MTTAPTPSLKGTVSTNVDPLRCDKCSGLLPLGTLRSLAYPCCGKMFCPSCQKKHLNMGARCCPACRTVASSSGTNRHLKKNAKKGHPWAHHFLAIVYQRGVGGRVQSDFEAVRSFRKAVSIGHPESMLRLGHLLCKGSGCDQDLTMAAEYAERAMGAHGDAFADDARTLLVDIAAQYLGAGNPTRAISMLSPLVESGHTPAKHMLGFSYFGAGEFSNALKWLEEAILDSWGSPNNENYRIASAQCAHFAMSWSIEQRNDPPRAKFWLTVTCKELRLLLSSDGFDPKGVIQRVSAVRGRLREIRNTCGGCGAPLHGAMRKKCGGCKTHCYCNRDCQKAHWNQSEGGHREQCKGAMELKAKMKEARKKGGPE